MSMGRQKSSYLPRRKLVEEDILWPATRHSPAADPFSETFENSTHALVGMYSPKQPPQKLMRTKKTRHEVSANPILVFDLRLSYCWVMETD
jgi:hypothetical protein